MPDRLRDVRVRVFLVGLVAFLLAVGYFFVPYLTVERTIVSSTPSPFPRSPKSATLIKLRPRSAVCLDLVGLEPLSEQALIRLNTRGRPRVPVAVELSGPGYRARSVLRPKDYVSGTDVLVPVRAPRRELLGEACIRNVGDGPVWATGSAEGPRVQSRSKTTVDGRPIVADVGLVFFEGRPASLSARAGAIVDRASEWKPFGPVAAWIVLGLLVVVVPVATLATVARAGDDEPAR